MGDCGSGLTQLALYISYQVPDLDYQDYQDYRDDAEAPRTVDLGLPTGRDRAPRDPPTDNPITRPPYPWVIGERRWWLGGWFTYCSGNEIC